MAKSWSQRGPDPAQVVNRVLSHRIGQLCGGILAKDVAGTVEWRPVAPSAHSGLKTTEGLWPSKGARNTQNWGNPNLAAPKPDLEAEESTKHKIVHGFMQHAL